ncbi:MAG: hypothetical protein ACRCUY_06725 [Thermoguttaceae bacterium]
MRAIVLFSGGLDSTLAAKILQLQHIEVIGLNFVTPFHDSSGVAKKMAESLGIELVIHRTGDDYIEMLTHPKWGYGKAVNPCIDCRIEMCRVAKNLMSTRNAGFVATGELAGQRPNSQMQHQLQLIERESGLEGYLLRPLSATVLRPTRAELEGMIDRKQLFGYTGRGRGRLIALAQRFGIETIPQPSTGCFLCEKSYAPRFFDLMKYEPKPTDWDAEILNAGRQIRISPQIKVVLARNQDHCRRLESLFARSDARQAILFIPETFLGPSALSVGAFSCQNCENVKINCDNPAIIGENMGINPAENSELFESHLQLVGSLMLRSTPLEKYQPETAAVLVHYRNGQQVVQRVISISCSELADQYRVI